MCAIFGVLDYRGKLTPSQRLPMVRDWGTPPRYGERMPQELRSSRGTSCASRKPRNPPTG